MNVFSAQSDRIIRAVGNRWQQWQSRAFYKKLPVEQVFSTIYQTQQWGSREDRPFCSGEGSVREDVVGPYCDMVRAFIEGNHIKRVVDLGCGDFGVGSRLKTPGLSYTGVDIVPSLIDYNQKQFGSHDVEFHCLNIIDDELPPGDLCLVRQVLQHLSNEQIQKALNSLKRYKYAIITEHVYSGPGLRRNLNRPHGPGIRLPNRSGVFLESPPFNCPAKLLLEVPIKPNEILRTLVISWSQPLDAIVHEPVLVAD